METFNWTKVELKLGNQRHDGKTGTAFNWTKVELKQASGKLDLSITRTFNWTKVELKLYEPIQSVRQIGF